MVVAEVERGERGKGQPDGEKYDDIRLGESESESERGGGREVSFILVKVKAVCLDGN